MWNFVHEKQTSDFIFSIHCIQFYFVGEFVYHSIVNIFIIKLTERLDIKC